MKTLKTVGTHPPATSICSVAVGRFGRSDICGHRRQLDRAAVRPLAVAAGRHAQWSSRSSEGQRVVALERSAL